MSVALSFGKSKPTTSPSFSFLMEVALQEPVPLMIRAFFRSLYSDVSRKFSLIDPIQLQKVP